MKARKKGNTDELFVRYLVYIQEHAGVCIFLTFTTFLDYYNKVCFFFFLLPIKV